MDSEESLRLKYLRILEPWAGSARTDLYTPPARPDLACYGPGYNNWGVQTNQKFLGAFKGSFTAPAMDANTGMDVFAIREVRDHPWIISTSRHISQGGVSLLAVRWDGERNVLSGSSSVVIGDPYMMTLNLPRGYRLASVEVGGQSAECVNQTDTATVRIVPLTTGTLEWEMTFSR